MRKILTLILAAGMLFGSVVGVGAVEFKAKGEWVMSFDYGQNGTFSGGNGMTGYSGSYDEFEAQQRIRLQMEAVVSEALSGAIFFEIGNQLWGKGDFANGNNTGGAALGADGTKSIELRRAYIDWLVPHSNLKVRMGIQGLSFPSYTTSSQIFCDDVAAVTLSYEFNDNVSITGFWARPFNDNYSGVMGSASNGTQANYLDNMDMFSVVLPLTFEGIKVTPWLMVAAIGPNTFRDKDTNFGNYGYYKQDSVVSRHHVRAGMFPAGGARHNDGTPSSGSVGNYGTTWWGGLTGELSTWDPFRIAFDFNYGSVNNADDGRWNRSGWLGSMLFEYKLEWGVPGLYGWYSSGDDTNPANGSERMPYLSVVCIDNGFSNYAFNGQPYIAREGTVGYSMAGTWGIGARIKDVSFIDDIKHTLRANYIGGTNSPSMAKKLVGMGFSANTNQGTLGMDPLYMTTSDKVLEIGLTNVYKISENLTTQLDIAYLATWLDHSKAVWGNSRMNGRSDQVRDPWNINLTLAYSF